MGGVHEVNARFLSGGGFREASLDALPALSIRETEGTGELWVTRSSCVQRSVSSQRFHGAQDGFHHQDHSPNSRKRCMPFLFSGFFFFFKFRGHASELSWSDKC